MTHWTQMSTRDLSKVSLFLVRYSGAAEHKSERKDQGWGSLLAKHAYHRM